MNEDMKKLSIKQLSNLLFIPENIINSLMEKHNLIEKRNRLFFFSGFLLVCFLCLFRGKTRHEDRKLLFRRMFDIALSKNAFSDRLSSIGTVFFKDILKYIQPRLNQIGSPKKREKVKQLIKNILIEDATIFKIDNRLENIFKQIPGSNSTGLKLYLSYNVFGNNKLSGTIKHSRFADMKKSGQKTKQTIEIRDRGWFSWQNLCDYKNDEKYFISRIQKQINPLITKVYLGDNKLVKTRFQKLDLSGYSEVDFEIKPFKDTSGSVYHLKDGKVFTLRMKGKKLENGEWYWYVFALPKADKLSFSDIHALYRARWNIEEMFREIKQAFGGDSLRLRHKVSVINHIYMMIISYLCCKQFLKKIANVNRKSPDGFMLDTCMKGTLRFEFIRIISYLIDDPLITKQKLKEISENFCECAYSADRANSNRKSALHRAIIKMEG